MDKKMLKEQILDALVIKKLPDDVLISTMTICCEMNIQFNVDNIAKYIELKQGGIIGISYGRDSDPTTNRTIGPKKKKIKHNKKQKREFHNQISLNVMIESKADKPVNIKLFTNGSIQMTGCKSVDNVVDVLNKVFTELKTVRAIIQKQKNNTYRIVEKPFIDDVSKLSLDDVENVTIGMINSNFIYPNKIDRLKLFNLLNSEGKECRYDPAIHAPVNIKFACADKSISILVFEKGSILITGAKNCSHVLDGYDFINRYLLTNHKKIVKSNITAQNISKYVDSPQKRGRKKKTDCNNMDDHDIDEAMKYIIESHY